MSFRITTPCNSVTSVVEFSSLPRFTNPTKPHILNICLQAKGDNMDKSISKIKLFNGVQVRHIWDEEAEKWWWSILDIIGILTDQPDYEKVRNYWKWLKNKLKAEGSQLVSNTNQLKLEAADGKKYLTDVADTEQIRTIFDVFFFFVKIRVNPWTLFFQSHKERQGRECGQQVRIGLCGLW